MAQRRLFSPDIVKSDAFLDMPTSSRDLYFYLAMDADDDGFVNPKRIMRVVGASDDDLKVLLSKRFVLPFQSGVVVIKHWLIHNSIRKDRYHETKYIEEKNTLFIKDNMAYTETKPLLATSRQPVGNQMVSEVKLSKVKLSKVKEGDTPAETNRDFFSEGKNYQSLYEEYCVKINPIVVEREFRKFILYWTEPSANGKKERWEKQPTFDTRRRLYTWFSKINEVKQFTNKGKGIA